MNGPVVQIDGQPVHVEQLLTVIETVDAWLDSAASPDYLEQPLAQDWARVTKVCEEAGEVWREQSRRTGENFRKGRCGSDEELVAELGDAAAAALFGIQHVTKDQNRTLAAFVTALLKPYNRALEASQEGSHDSTQ